MSTATYSFQQSFFVSTWKLAVYSLIFTVVVSAPLRASPETALDDYVNTFDPNYSFFHAAPPEIGPGFTFHLLLMTSQEWRTTDEVDRTLWSHWMGVIVPDQVITDTGMLLILGGSSDSTVPFDDEELAAAADLALASGSVITLLDQVPNQPLFFSDEPFEHREDTLVAHTWDKAMVTGDYTWPAYLPMTKSVVRAMDTVQTVVPTVSSHAVDQFVVVGFSKRGAVTWLTAAVDPRVRAIAPGVIDFLNLAPHIEHHYSAYGFYSSALEDYVNYDVVRRVRTPEGQALLQVVDPYSYLDRLDMPKLLMNSSGDQFFLPDSSQLYFNDLLGENHIHYAPNTDHALEDSDGSLEDALIRLLSWYLTVLFDVPRPQISWTHQDGQLSVATDQVPTEVKLWQASNTTARDFRLETIGATWTDTVISSTNPNEYVVSVPVPNEGWTAYFVELTYIDASGLPQTYSTQVYINPDTLPFEVSDSLLEPRGVGFWKHQVSVAQEGTDDAQLPAEVLSDYFPIPIFDMHVTDLEHAQAVFDAEAKDIGTRALKHCLALRLNVADAQLGWYTRLEIGDSPVRFLWEHWNDAHSAFLADDPRTAKDICETINTL